MTQPPSDAPEGARVLTDLRSLGGFYALVSPVPAGSDALPWAEVLAEDALTARFAAVRAALAASTGMQPPAVDARVAVSATQVGLASRLWSPALGGAVLHGWVPDLSSANLVASPVHRGAVPLGVRDASAGVAVGSAAEAAEAIARLVVRDSLAQLHTACSAVGRTAVRVLVSNSASALTGAGRVLAGQAPEHTDQIGEIVRLLLAVPEVAAGGGFSPDGSFLRSGCCLFYRIPEHGLCPDCVLAPAHPEQVTEAH
ncbi:(2Fe-2S)-binding protein [Ornithinimicrobium panacihumi]|uniref:(2Fe-2S)-binding protein n=1 Tax=Ornithinimicrobium panacihumi TaxID=2008449 RepID=UPI003F8C0EB4